MSVFQALSPTDHVIAPKDAFYGTADLLRDLFARWGLETTFLDMTDPANVRQAIQPKTKLVWVETPSNPLLKITISPQWRTLLMNPARCAFATTRGLLPFCRVHFSSAPI